MLSIWKAYSTSGAEVLYWDPPTSKVQSGWVHDSSTAISAMRMFLKLASSPIYIWIVANKSTSGVWCFSTAHTCSCNLKWSAFDTQLFPTYLLNLFFPALVMVMILFTTYLIVIP